MSNPTRARPDPPGANGAHGERATGVIFHRSSDRTDFLHLTRPQLLATRARRTDCDGEKEGLTAA